MRRFNAGQAALGALLLAIFTVVVNRAESYRNWHPDAFTGWTLFGFFLLLVGAGITAVLIVMSVKGDAVWTTPLAFVIGLITGVGSVFFFQKVDIRWQEALVGLLVFGLVGALFASIVYLCGRR